MTGKPNLIQIPQSIKPTQTIRFHLDIRAACKKCRLRAGIILFVKGTISDRRVFGDKDMNYFVVYTQIKDDGHPGWYV